MLKALLWKEWRENWIIVVIGIIAITLIAFLVLINKEFNVAVYDIRIIFLFIPFFIAVIAANIFSTEFSHNTVSFLLLQPISRTQIWITKTIVSILLILLLTLGSALGVVLISHLTSTPITFSSFSFWEEDSLYQSLVIFNLKVIDLLYISCLIYAATLFISILFSNTMVAIFAGILFTGVIAIIWIPMAFLFEFFHLWYGKLWIPAIILVFCSWLTFIRSDLLLIQKRILYGFKILVGTFLIVSLLFIFIQSNHDEIFPSQIRYINPKLVIPQKNLVLAEIETDYSSRLWLISYQDKKYLKIPGKGYIFYDQYQAVKASSLSPDTKYIVLGSKRRFWGLVESLLFMPQLVIMDTNTLAMHKLPIKPSGFLCYQTPLGWSPDSKKLYFMTASPFKGKSGIGFIDIDSGKTELFTPPKINRWNGTSYLATDKKSFYALQWDKIQDQYRYTIYQIDLKGNILWQHSQYKTFTGPYISPDGKWLLYHQSTAYNNPTSRLCLMNLETKETTPLPEKLMVSPFYWSPWSPDSKWLATIEVISTGRNKLISSPTKGRMQIGPVTVNTMQFESPEFGENIYALWVINLATKQPVKLASKFDAQFILWSPDGKKIGYYKRIEHKINSMVLEETDLETGKIKEGITWEQHDTLLPNGNYLRSDRNRLFMVTPNGNQVKQIYP